MRRPSRAFLLVRVARAASVAFLLLGSACEEEQKKPEPVDRCATLAGVVDACIAQLGAPPDPSVHATCAVTTCEDKEAAIDCVLAAPCDERFADAVRACQAANGCVGPASPITCWAVPDQPPARYGNPEGFTVHTLSADGLCSKQAAINGVSVDTSSPAAIDASVQAMIASTRAPATVREVRSATPDLAVDFTQARPLPPRFYGLDLQWWSKYFLDLPSYRALVRNMQVDILRFPGGQERVEYLRGVATRPWPGDELGKDQPYQFILTSEDVARFIGFCRELGIEPQLEFNLYNVAPDTLGQHPDGKSMWADMVDQVVNELGYDLKYMSASNEPEVNIFDNWRYLSNPDGSPATSAAEAIGSYMRRFVEYRAALEAVHPGMKYTLAETGNWAGLEDTLDLFLGELQGVDPGALSFHWYPMGQWEGQPYYDPAYPSLAHMVVNGNQGHSISALAGAAATARRKLAEHGLAGDELFLGEWGPAWSATPETAQIQDRLATAIFSAEVHELTKTLGYDTVEYFSLSDPTLFQPWVPSVIAVDEQDRVSVRPQYYVHLMYRWLYGDEIVPVPGGQQDDWSIYAARSQATGERHLMLINRTASSTFTKVVEVTTPEGKKLLGLTLHPHSVAIVTF